MSNLERFDMHIQAWYQQPLGQILGHIEDTELRHVLPKCFGSYLLQLGGTELLPALQTSPIPFHFGISPEIENTNKSTFTQSSYTQLPIQTESMNAVILWHALETENKPEAMLNETWRVLAPDGHLIILGFNPWSLWGIKHLFSHQNYPWNTHFHSAQTLCHWVHRMSGEIISAKSIFFRPPLQNPQTLHKLSWLEALGLWLWPHMGGIYLLVIQKRTIPLTPAKLNIRWQTAVEDKTFSPTAGSVRRG